MSDLLIPLIVMAESQLLSFWSSASTTNLSPSRTPLKTLSQIEVQLKRRRDLIPNLIETVKGYMKHERETLDAVVSRQQAVSGLKLPLVILVTPLLSPNSPVPKVF